MIYYYNMVTDELLDFWMWVSTNTSLGWIGGSAIALSLSSNLYMYKKLRDKNYSEKKFVEVLEKLEPLLSKIINKGDKIFTKTEIDDAKVIRRMINFKTVGK